MKLPYTIRPGGAKGTIVLDRSGKTSTAAELRVPRSLRKVAGLACGELTIAERPAGCKATRAIFIASQKPQPPVLRVPRKGGCVIWGNKDGSVLNVRFHRSSPDDAHIGRRRLLPKAAVTWDYFYRSSPGTISYTIDPGGAKGTILLE